MTKINNFEEYEDVLCYYEYTLTEKVLYGKIDSDKYMRLSKKIDEWGEEAARKAANE